LNTKLSQFTRTTSQADEPPAGALDRISIDNIVFGVENGKLMVLTAKYHQGTADGQWGLLGGWIYEDEHIDDAAKRIVLEETGVSNVYLEQLRAFGTPNRYPLKRIITLAYFALVRPELYHLIPGNNVSELAWRDARQKR
jgi:ADP-ribose pyrophosphatase YjhB (NUDIX family)